MTYINNEMNMNHSSYLITLFPSPWCGLNYILESCLWDAETINELNRLGWYSKGCKWARGFKWWCTCYQSTILNEYVLYFSIILWLHLVGLSKTTLPNAIKETLKKMCQCKQSESMQILSISTPLCCTSLS